MSETLAARANARSLASHGMISIALIALLGGGLLAFASIAEISGAVITPGTAIVESYPKRIQHQDGGTIAAILVHDDQQVEAGALLVRLDATSLRATVILAQQQLAEALVEAARLKAELAGAEDFAWPNEVDFLDDDHRAALREAQRQALMSELGARSGRVSQLREQATQLESEIEGLNIQHDAVVRQIAIIATELAGIASLSDQKLVPVSKVNDLSKEKASQEGEAGRLTAAIAQARASIAERQFQIEQISSDFSAQALASLQKARQEEASARQQLTLASEKLLRTEVRAPQSGVVHELAVHTIGGVVNAGETMMEIVPTTDSLVFELRVDPTDIDQVEVGQDVRLRLTSYDSRSTPDLRGTVQSVSPDFVQPQGQRSYYTATVVLGESELARLPPDVHLRPGIPAEAFVVTDSRTVLSYLIHPIVEQLQLALRDGK